MPWYGLMILGMILFVVGVIVGLWIAKDDGGDENTYY